ncbi:MAG: 4-oxalocrotonate tautomerase [Solirubrobacteraceae bacterium]|nr:4-oxalocrotonate tautomerase [Solirubrobacteraceae bacterium]
MPIIRVEMFEGRTLEQKRALAEAITAAVVEHADAPRQSVRVIFTDMAKEDWAVGGELRSDRDAREATEAEVRSQAADTERARAVESEPIGPEGRSSAT